MIKTFHIVDEINRLKEVRFYCSLDDKVLDSNNEQYISHGISYVGARNLYKDMGIKMGLDYER